MEQTTLFDTPESDNKTDFNELLLYALGEFQARKKVLADRELPLDRLRGAFRRASEFYQTEELSDETLARILQEIGIKVVRVPPFVAKHPFRVTVSADVAESALTFYKKVSADKNKKVSKN